MVLHYLPRFDIPEKKPLWQLGKKENWLELWKQISPLVDGDFWVKDRRSEIFLDYVRFAFDGSRSDDRKDGVLQTILIQQRETEINPELVENLISLGIHPDVPNSAGQTPLYSCLLEGLPKSFKYFVNLRVNFHQRNSSGRTVKEEAARIKATTTSASVLLEVANLAEEFLDADCPCPSVAQLAAERSYYAVLNLIRRRVVSEEEILEKYEGRNVVEWAEHWEQFDLRDELIFRYPELKPETDRDEVMQVLINKVTELENAVEKLQFKAVELEEKLGNGHL